MGTARLFQVVNMSEISKPINEIAFWNSNGDYIFLRK